MAEQARQKVTVYDLTQNVPEGVSLSGLSVPKFDGANYYRQPTGESSTIGFSTTGTRFVQFEYQFYSLESTVTGSTALDGLVLNKRIFPAGIFTPTETQGAFVGMGKHSFTLNYTCKPYCKDFPNQYWNKLTVIDGNWDVPQEKIGLNSERLRLDVPGSKLTYNGLGSLSFDGVNYGRRIKNDHFILEWPKGYLPLSLSFTISANQSVKATTKIGNSILSVDTTDANNQIASNINLVKYKDARSVTVQVECAESSQSCASLYAPNIDVQTPQNISIPLIAIVGLALMILGALALLLGFGPHLRKA